LAKIAYSTQIEPETLNLLNEYIKKTGESKASVTNQALLNYIKAKEHDLEKEQD
jgi:hypothetical protein